MAIKMNKGIWVMLVVIILIYVMVINKDAIQFSADCELYPDNPNCECYDGKVKTALQTGGYDCIEPECYPDSVETDCGGLYHIACVGEWQCQNNKCAWVCTK